MSEEEKKAIEKLKKYNELYSKGYCEDCNELCVIDNFPNKDLYNVTLIVLNLLEKQQKEIEYLKEMNKELHDINFRVSKNLLELAETSISKGKIKKFIRDELPDDEIMECCDIYDINGVDIRKKLEELLEED